MKWFVFYYIHFIIQFASIIYDTPFDHDYQCSIERAPTKNKPDDQYILLQGFCMCFLSDINQQTYMSYNCVV